MAFSAAASDCASGPCIVIDLGGRSTEVTIGKFLFLFAIAPISFGSGLNLEVLD